ncbi:hypothetical protein B0H12DRAFT_1091400 [Mycena haematopus]|nr:hypothetical protein B0H12DRAFT_1091400 [Mycena haematopus]
MSSADTYHPGRMEACQTVFCVDVPRTEQSNLCKRVELSLPPAGPSKDTIDRFWRRVAEATTRCHDVESKWIRGDESRLWNEQNRQACSK